MDCAHTDGVYMRPAINEHGEEIAVYKCPECGATYMEGAP